MQLLNTTHINIILFLQFSLNLNTMHHFNEFIYVAMLFILVTQSLIVTLYKYLK